MAELFAQTTGGSTASTVPAISAVRRLRHRQITGRLDYLRELRKLSMVMTQSELARALGLTQPSISSALKSAAKIADPQPGFCGATAYEIAQRFTAGDIDREELVDQLSRWQDAPEIEHRDRRPVDDVAAELGGLSKALRDGLLDAAAYQQILDRRSNLHRPTAEMSTATASGE